VPAETIVPKVGHNEAAVQFEASNVVLRVVQELHRLNRGFALAVNACLALSSSIPIAKT
jgi:hypothetical protein